MSKIGNMTVSQAMPYLSEIAKMYGLQLNRLKEWKLARAIMASRYGMGGTDC